MKKYNGYLIDLDGTMYLGKEPIAEASGFIEALRKKEIPYLFVTNNSSKTQADVAAKLNQFGIYAKPEHVVTTSLATARYIKELKEDASCYVIGEEGVKAAIEAEGLTISENEQCDFVVVGMDREVNYEKFAKACLAVRNGATFISTNGDIAIPTERGLLPGNGSLTSVVAVSTGVAPTFIGKPEKIIMEQALEILGTSKEETIMVGDNYQTDIKAGIKAELDTLMVFTGVTPFEEMSTFATMPTYFVHSLKEWIERI
ncbi:TIGR01457 family HAD-type hydrolase [Oceanobacillus manasiensis]|uniref:TIGR01457 family HAD-type hydrolase n=1 Tax=Oceanobacillus manasiensis TaxID=586413 RepID=UPI0005A95060|nr:TIGR01457 family HAD-type hydrolase [Oceanobacillus manasiensis]